MKLFSLNLLFISLFEERMAHYSFFEVILRSIYHENFSNGPKYNKKFNLRYKEMFFTGLPATLKMPETMKLP